MTFLATSRICLLLLSAVALALPAHSQTTLTGAIWFATTPTGGTSIDQGYADGAVNTLGGDSWWDLWLALNPNATAPLNGPSDEQASISILLDTGRSSTFYLFAGGPCCSLKYSGINLFFDGDNSTPGISVFGALNTTSFLPNANSSTFSLAASIAPGSGTGFYRAGSDIVVLTGYNWNSSGTLDVCQAFEFSPGTEPSATGSISLRVFPAAILTSSQASAAPGTKVTLTGTGFAPMETVAIYFGGISFLPLATTTADCSGGFAITARVPQAPYGPEDVYAVGQTSGKLGAASIFVTPALSVSPRTGAPGGAATAQGVGFGEETVQVYWGNPRQLLGTAAANGSGSFTGSSALEFTIPTNASPGSNAVTGIGQATDAIAIGEITVK